MNPISGGVDKSQLPSAIDTVIDESAYQCEIAYTQYGGHATEISRQTDADIVVAVGGDGTVNEVASGMVGTDKILGIVPMGSGDGFARHLGLSHNVRKALGIINDGKYIKADTGLINGKTFLCTCGVGLDAEVGYEFSKGKKRGLMQYVKIGVKTLLHYDPKAYSLEIDGKHYDETALLMTIGNANQWGNNAYVTPDASVEDGLFDITIAHGASIPGLAWLACLLMTKRLKRSRNVTFKRAKEITIHNSSPIHAHYDGEPVAYSGDIKINIVPASLNVIVP